MKFNAFYCFLITVAFSFSAYTCNAGIHFTESFTSAFVTTSYNSGSATLSSGTWDFSSIKGETSANSYGSSGGAARFNVSIPAGSYIVTPSVNSIGTISFYYRELNSGGGTFTVQKSVGGGSFVNIGTQTYSGMSFNQYTLTINDPSSDIRIRIISINNPGFLIVDEVSLTDYALGPILSTNTTVLNGFNYVLGSGPSSSQSFNLSGSNLTGGSGNITVTAPLHYEVSLNNSSFSTSTLVPYSSATLASTPIYARLIAGLAVGSYNSESIIISGGGATDVTLSCSGTVSSPPTPAISVTPSTLSGFTYIVGAGPSISQNFNLSGNNLTPASGNISITAPASYELSLNNTTFSSSLNAPYSSSSLSSTTVYVRLIAGLSVNTYNAQTITVSGGGASDATVTCNGNVISPPPPVLTANPSTMSGFTYVVGAGPSASQSFSLSGSNLTGVSGDISIATTGSYELSLDNITFSTSKLVPYSSSTLAATNIYVRLIAGLSLNNYNSETISISGGGSSAINVTCNGAVTAVPPPALNATSTSLNGFTYFEGSGPSVSQSYSLSGSNLTGTSGNINITAPANYEISSDDISFSGSLVIAYSSSTLTTTTIYVHLKSGLPIGVFNSEMISNVGGGASIDVSCNGEVKEVSLSCASDLIISEYHEPASGNNKGVEIYNGTGADVDLSDYYIGVIVNGGADIENSQVLNGILGDKQTACIYNDADADPNFRLKGDINIPWSNATWNGDDAIYLLKGGATLGFIIDVIGDMPPVTDPGTEFINNGITTLNTCLIRKDTVTSPTSPWNGIHWNVLTSGTYTDWGVHTMVCPTAINTHNNEVMSGIELYPNPNNGTFDIILPENIETYNILITNILGEVIYESTSFKSEINLQQKAGIYMICVYNDQQKFTKKFIVY